MSVLTIIMMVPLLTMTFIPKDPNGGLARLLSWIPLYTPFTMMKPRRCRSAIIRSHRHDGSAAWRHCRRPLDGRQNLPHRHPSPQASPRKVVEMNSLALRRES